MPRFTLSLLLLACAFTAPAFTAGAAATITAGAARADITPDVRMLNWVGLQPYGEVHDPIFVRVLALSDGETRAAIVAWDLLDAREYAVARVRQAIADATDIPAGNIIVHASHNHSGPKSEMGPEPITSRERRTSLPAQQDPHYRAWADRLVETCVDLARRADASRVPVTISIGRAYAGEWLFNRRPLKADGTVRYMSNPRDPYALPEGLQFGAVDPTLTVLSLRTGDRPVATLMHLAAHAVSIYPTYKGVSADWPGPVLDRLRGELGGEAFFLQGCAGDIVPGRRGFEAVAEMTSYIAARAIAAESNAAPLETGALHVSRAVVGAPATPAARHDLRLENIDCEVQVLTCGGLALVTLPGEPLTGLNLAIRERSPFPHTIVLGYSNGRGVGYVGLPGEKAKGGYEMSEVGAGTDEAGQLLIETAVRLLNEHAARR